MQLTECGAECGSAAERRRAAADAALAEAVASQDVDMIREALKTHNSVASKVRLKEAQKTREKLKGKAKKVEKQQRQVAEAEAARVQVLDAVRAIEGAGTASAALPLTSELPQVKRKEMTRLQAELTEAQTELAASYTKTNEDVTRLQADRQQLAVQAHELGKTADAGTRCTVIECAEQHLIAADSIANLAVAHEQPSAMEAEEAAEATRLQAEQAGLQVLQVLESGEAADELHAAIKTARCHTDLSAALPMACERLRAIEAEERASQLAVSKEMSMQRIEELVQRNKQQMQRIEELVQRNEQQMQRIEKLEAGAGGDHAGLEALRKERENAFELAAKAGKEIESLKEAAASKWKRATDFKVSVLHAWLYAPFMAFSQARVCTGTCV